MASPKVEVVVKNSCASIGEGPHWDVPSQTLVYVDIDTGGVQRWNSLTGEQTKVNFDGTVGFVMPCDRGGYVIGHNKAIVHFDGNSTATATILAEVDAEKKSRFNDGKCDASGRLWAGTMGLESSTPGVVERGQGSLYSLSTDHKITKQASDIDLSNGLDWTDDNTVMYFIDSVPRKVYAYDFNLAEGTISNRRTAVDFEKDATKEYGLPDGMCIDNEGKIWVACFQSSRVYRFDPETGKTLQHVEFPATNITSVCFGGKNLDELFVTCSRWRLEDESKQPLAGSIFRVTGLGVKGRAPNNFKG